MSLLVGSFLDAPSTILRARPHVNLSQSRASRCARRGAHYVRLLGACFARGLGTLPGVGAAFGEALPKMQNRRPLE